MGSKCPYHRTLEMLADTSLNFFLSLYYLKSSLNSRLIYTLRERCSSAIPVGLVKFWSFPWSSRVTSQLFVRYDGVLQTRGKYKTRIKILDDSFKSFRKFNHISKVSNNKQKISFVIQSHRWFCYRKFIEW